MLSTSRRNLEHIVHSVFEVINLFQYSTKILSSGNFCDAVIKTFPYSPTILASGNFCEPVIKKHFLTGTGIRQVWVKISEPVSEKFGTGKSLGTSIGKIWYRQKVPVSVWKVFGTGKKYRYWYRSTFWVPSHTDM